MTDNNTTLVGNLLMLCGCLHDISEKSKEHYTQKQVTEIQERLESICLINFPKIMLEIKP